ncbi:metal-dependent hydrolase [Granulicella arctica]|uniref:metal-dependent hydrolase n=1 Tax=Granulicella arctica TaxID=940613 RepID=UPI0021DF5A62|nr:metal-dependent hydrolase [Granulicella arctica]
MEPVTHFLTGACLARTGLNRRAAYTTLAMTLAAEAPDLDTLWSVDGPVAGFQHHRGWTHTFLGIPFEAALVVGLIWLLHRWRVRRGYPTLAPVRWGMLWLFSVIALLSHIFLDWTNNYGVRPFFPFNAHWYAGSFVFIFEPVLFAILLVALIAPALFGLVGSEVGARRQPFRGRGWAIGGLIAMLALWGWRASEHSKAIDLATAGDYDGAQVRRVFASPEPINPYRWHVIAELPTAFQLGVAETLSGTLTTTPDDLLYKPPTTIATLPAKRSWLGEVYLDWSSWPMVTDIGPDGDGFTEVTFRDLRFMYDTPFMRGRTMPPLGGIVYLDADRRIKIMEMNGRPQH